MPDDHQMHGREFFDNSIQGFLANGKISLVRRRPTEIGYRGKLPLASHVGSCIGGKLEHGPTGPVPNYGDVHAGMQPLNFVA